MLAVPSAIPSPEQPRILGSIRNAEPDDAPELARLLAAVRIDPEALGGDLAPGEQGHLLVLDLDGALCAAACVTLERGTRPRARLRLLIVDPALRSAERGVEARMIGVAIALCEAYGCAELDVVAPTSGSRFVTST
jgi:hypothetical protein